MSSSSSCWLAIILLKIHVSLSCWLRSRRACINSGKERLSLPIWQSRPPFLSTLFSLYRSPYFDHVSDDAKSLIKHMLVVNPDKRITASACLQHSWFKTCDKKLEMNVLSDAKEGIKSFKAKRHFKGAVEAVSECSSHHKHVLFAYCC